MRDRRACWFPAKQYGWGWGLPTAWQGWVVLGIFFFLVGIGAFTLLPESSPYMFVAYCLLLCLALVAVCWAKGEPPRWRWGRK
jgi:hypothetical protein